MFAGLGRAELGWVRLSGLERGLAQRSGLGGLVALAGGVGLGGGLHDEVLPQCVFCKKRRWDREEAVFGCVVPVCHCSEWVMVSCCLANVNLHKGDKISARTRQALNSFY